MPKVKITEAKEVSFTSWSEAQGITTSGIEYCKIPGRGLGIVAQRNLKVNRPCLNSTVTPVEI